MPTVEGLQAGNADLDRSLVQIIDTPTFAVATRFHADSLHLVLPVWNLAASHFMVCSTNIRSSGWIFRERVKWPIGNPS